MNRLRAAWHALLARLGLELDWAMLDEDPTPEPWFTPGQPPAERDCPSSWSVTRYGYLQAATWIPDERETHDCTLPDGHQPPCLCDCGATYGNRPPLATLRSGDTITFTFTYPHTEGTDHARH